MGVLTLLKHLAPCLKDSHVERYRGKTVAVDGNTFIFRGCYSCSEQVATGQPCSGPVDYLLKRVNMLKHYGVEPWVVLDGRRTPMKDDTNKQRREDREKNLRIAKDVRRQAEDKSGEERDALLLKAQTFFQKSIHVTRQMVTNAMAVLKREGVACMVAPYEADAQVAFLVKCGLASAVITEDSDILVYMAAVKSTASVLYKMDEFGKCKELGFDAEKLSSLPGVIGKFGRGLAAFAGDGGGRLFVQLATLAGCDYVDNVRGVGLISALAIISRFKSVPADRRVTHILLHLQKARKTVPEGHRERMALAEMSFFWHRVYDPRSKTCVHFCDAAPELIGTAEVPSLPPTAGEMEFLGEHIDDELMGRISNGKVDPATGLAVTAEIHPTPAHTRGNRSMTQPGSTCSRGRTTATPVWAKSATMPMTTPRGAWNQQRKHSGPNTNEVRPFSQQAHRQPSSRRTQETPRKPAGGLLKDLFERARSKTEDKENMPAGRDEFLNISDVVLACGPGRTPSRGRTASPPSSTAAVIPNPFAIKSGSITAVAASPSTFFTPAASNAGAQRQSDASHAASAEHMGGVADAWSRLGNGCLGGAREHDDITVSRGDTGVQKKDEKQRERDRAHGVQSVRERVPAVERAANRVGKRPLPTLGRTGAGNGRGKKTKPGTVRKSQPRSAGQVTTMLSFFGRASASKS